MSSVKKRYDGKGSEFGKAHRLLPVFCGMFDIDKMKATATMDLELKNICVHLRASAAHTLT